MATFRNSLFFLLSWFPLNVFSSGFSDYNRTETYLGYVHYAGGFEPNANLRVNVIQMKSLRLHLSNSCQGAQILEAATTSNGFVTSAELIDPDRLIYKVNTPLGNKIREVTLSLDGPAPLNCNIAVYATFEAAPSHTHSIDVLNDSTYDANIALAFRKQGQWVTYGWKRVYSKTCTNVVTGVEGEIYGYGYTPTGGGFWPALGEKSFCVNKGVVGYVPEYMCQNENSEFEWKAFRKFQFQSPSGTHTWTITD